MSDLIIDPRTLCRVCGLPRHRVQPWPPRGGIVRYSQHRACCCIGSTCLGVLGCRYSPPASLKVVLSDVAMEVGPALTSAPSLIRSALCSGTDWYAAYGVWAELVDGDINGEYILQNGVAAVGLSPECGFSVTGPPVTYNIYATPASNGSTNGIPNFDPVHPLVATVSGYFSMSLFIWGGLPYIGGQMSLGAGAVLRVGQVVSGVCVPEQFIIARNFFESAVEYFNRRCSANAATDTITTIDAVTRKHFDNGTLVRFVATPDSSATLPAPLVRNRNYYVVNSVGYDFQVALTVGGEPVDLLDSGVAPIWVWEPTTCATLPNRTLPNTYPNPDRPYPAATGGTAVVSEV